MIFSPGSPASDGPDITGTPSAGNYARWSDANTLEARTTAQVLADIGAQASDTDLTAIAALTSAADKVPYATGAGTWALADLTAAGRALIDDANAAAQLVTLGVAEAITGTKLDDLTAPDDNTDLNASSTRHGLLPKLSNVATEYLNGQGAWATPAGGVTAVVVAAYKTTDTTGLAADTYNKITFDTERLDTNSAFASSTFTAPSTGKYRIDLNLRAGDNGATREGMVVLYVDAARVSTTARYASHTDNKAFSHSSWILSLTSGQTVEVYMQHEDGANGYINGIETLTGGSNTGCTELLIAYLGA